MKAIIMAGGEGTRLRPLTATMPKPMAQVVNKPAMEHSILLLKKHGITEIGVTLLYMPEAIRSYFGDGSAFGVHLQYFLEETPLGTAGSVKNTGDFLEDDFLVLSGDAITDADLTAFISYHKEKKAEATLLLCPMDIPLEYGVVVTEESGRIVRFLEKPSWSQVFSDTVNTGIYILNPSVLSLCRKFPADFSKDIFPKLLAEGRPLYGYISKDYWCDIGDLDAYRHCHYDIFAGKTKLSPDACRLSQGVYAEEGAVIEAGAVVHPPVLIGRNARIKSGAKVDAYTSIGEGCIIESGASIKRSVLLDKVTVERNAQIRGSILCKHAHIGEGAALYEQSVIGEDSRIGADAVIKPGVRVWPSKVVGQGEILSANLVWGNAASGELFGERGVGGRIGTDLSPHAAQKMGQAVGTVYEGQLGVAADGSRAGDMLKQAVVSGILSTGRDVVDFGSQPLPATRFGMRSFGLSAGVHISAEKNRGSLELLTKEGVNPSPGQLQKIRTIYFREEFKEAEGTNIGTANDGRDYERYYLRFLLQGMEKMPNMRILVSSASERGRRILSAAMAELGCTVLYEEENIEFTDKEKLRCFAEKVPQKGCGMGAILDSVCESVILVDERGRIADGDLYTLLSALMVMRNHENPRIFARSSTPTVLEEMGQREGATIVRTKNSSVSLMEGLSGKEPAEEEQFIRHFDGIGAILRTVDFLYRKNTKLSALIDEIPPFYIHRRSVPCAQKDKGRLMRILSADAPAENKTEGVRFSEKHGWVLILPDGERAACRIIAQGDKEEYAAELMDLYHEKIKEILKE